MSEMLYILILAILQGIAEFLPISSSGHLVIGKSLLSAWWPEAVASAGGMQLEVALHAGTLGSILIVFAKDLWQLRRDWRMCLLIIVASVPAGIIGLTLKKSLETMFESPLVAGCGLLVTAVFLLLGQKLASGRFTEKNQPWSAAFVVGCFQAIALVPGISRSGSTISGGLLTGLERTAAAKFSFLMAIPAVGGAALLEAKDLIVDQMPLAYGLAPLMMGVLVSFLVGIVSLKFLLRVIARGQLHWFAYYCVLVGSLTILWQLASPAG